MEDHIGFEKHSARRQCSQSDGFILVTTTDDHTYGPLSSMIEQLHYSPIRCRDGYEAIIRFKKLSENTPLVILETGLPLVDVTEAFTEIRRIQPDVKVVLVSNNPPNMSCSENALDGFIQKPYSESDAYSILETVLNQEYRCCNWA